MPIKHIYLFRGSDDEAYDSFKDRMLSLGSSVSSDPLNLAISLTVTESPPPAFSVIPFKKKKIAAVSVFREDGELIEVLSGDQRIAGIYLVEEALPVSYEKTWADRVKTPGACLLTLFMKRPGIDRERFLDIWHNSHTPLSLKIHPLWHYNRNVIDDRLGEGAEAWDGIVEEHFRSRSELLNPTRFFGNAFKMIYYMLEVYLDTRSFLDYKTIEPYLVSEYHIKS